MAAPIFITDQNLSDVYEDDNIVFSIQTNDVSDKFDLVVKSNGILPSLIADIGVKSFLLNGTKIFLGSNTPSSLISYRTFDSEFFSATGLMVGDVFSLNTIVSGNIVQDDITQHIIVDGGTIIYPISGDLIIGSSAGLAIISLSNINTITDLVNAINIVTNNNSYGIEAIDRNGSLRLVKKSLIGDNNIIVNSGNLITGDVGILNGIYELGIYSVSESINSQKVNCVNLTASINGSVGSKFLQIDDSVSAIKLSGISSSINSILSIDKNSSVPINDIINDINSQSSITGVIAENNNNVLQLIGSKINLYHNNEMPDDSLDVLLLGKQGSPFLPVPVNNFLEISRDTGTIYGITPTVPFPVSVDITVRATNTSNQTTDNKFIFNLLSKNNKDIKWLPGSVGVYEEGSISTANIDFVTDNDILKLSNIYALSPKTFDFMDYDLDSAWGFSRKTSATYFDNSGRLTVATKDEPRFDHGYSAANMTTDLNGLLIEETSTNLIKFSEDFNNLWVNNNVLLTPNAILDLTFKYNNAFKLGGTSSNSTHGINYSISLNSGSTYSFSLFAKAGNSRYLWLRLSNLNTYGLVFDLINGTIIDYSTINSPIRTYNPGNLQRTTKDGSLRTLPLNVDAVYGSIDSYKDGWFRCTLTFDTSSTLFDMGIYLPDPINYATNPETPFDATGNDIYIFGAQLEEQPLSTSYIKTNGDIETRQKDDIIIRLYDIDYEILVTDNKGNTVTKNITVNGRKYRLTPNINTRHVQKVTINQFHQEKMIDGLDLYLKTDGTISGRFPMINSTSQEFYFRAILDYQDELLLGPDDFSFQVVDKFLKSTLDFNFDIFFDDADGNTWNQFLASSISPEIRYRPYDNNFGVFNRPNIRVIADVKDNEIFNESNFISIQKNLKPFELVLSSIQTASLGEYDVVYFTVNDTGSKIESYYNGSSNNAEIVYPSSSYILRKKIKDIIGMEFEEKLYEWQNAWEPIIIAGYTMPGQGDIVLKRFYEGGFDKIIIGMVLTISEVTITKNDFSSWFSDENHKILPFKGKNLLYNDADNVINAPVATTPDRARLISSGDVRVIDTGDYRIIP